MGAFAGKPQKRDFAVRSDKTPAIAQDSLENLAGRLNTINTQAGAAQPTGFSGVSGTTGVSTGGSDDTNEILDKGVSPINALLSGGSIGDSLERAALLAGDPAGELGIAPKAIDQLRSLLGITGAEAAREGARLQSEVANLGIAQVEQAQQQARQDLLPFQQLGLDQIPGIGQSLQTLGGIQAPDLQSFDQRGLAAITQELGRRGTESLQGQAQAGLQQGLADVQGLRENAFSGGLNPDILGSEFNQALLGNIQGQIDPRFAGTVGQEAQLQSENLAQQDLQSRLQQNNQRFAQLQQGMNRRQNAQQIGFGQTGQQFGTALQAGGQQFGQTAQAQDLANQVAQQDFANQTLSQQQDFGQRAQLLAGGQAAAVGQANAGQATGQSISELLQQQGNVQAAGGIGAAQALGQGAQNTGNLITTGLGLFL